jgi:CheY-like chemotaxis protein
VREEALRVLLVDDDRVNRMVGRRLLTQLGCQVVLAEDGLDALDKYDAATDLVLMDCEMPQLDGWSATRRLRDEQSSKTPIVAVTAYTSQEDRRRCYDAGMDDFVPKPLSREALSAVIDRWS